MGGPLPLRSKAILMDPTSIVSGTRRSLPETLVSANADPTSVPGGV